MPAAFRSLDTNVALVNVGGSTTIELCRLNLETGSVTSDLLPGSWTSQIADNLYKLIPVTLLSERKNVYFLRMLMAAVDTSGAPTASLSMEATSDYRVVVVRLTAHNADDTVMLHIPRTSDAGYLIPTYPEAGVTTVQGTGPIVITGTAESPIVGVSTTDQFSVTTEGQLSLGTKVVSTAAVPSLATDVGKVPMLQADGTYALSSVAEGGTYAAKADGGLTLDTDNTFSVDSQVVRTAAAPNLTDDLGKVPALKEGGSYELQSVAKPSDIKTYAAKDAGGLTLDPDNKFAVDSQVVRTAAAPNLEADLGKVPALKEGGSYELQTVLHPGDVVVPSYTFGDGLVDTTAEGAPNEHTVTLAANVVATDVNWRAEANTDKVFVTSSTPGEPATLRALAELGEKYYAPSTGGISIGSVDPEAPELGKPISLDTTVPRLDAPVDASLTYSSTVTKALVLNSDGTYTPTAVVNSTQLGTKADASTVHQYGVIPGGGLAMGVEDYAYSFAVDGTIPRLLNNIGPFELGNALVVGAYTPDGDARLITMTVPSKDYVDGVMAGLKYTEAVKKTYTSTRTKTQLTADGLVTGDRFLVNDGSAAGNMDNGVYVVPASGTPSRATDFDGDPSTEGVRGAYVFDLETGIAYVCSNAFDADVPGTHAIKFVTYKAGTTYSAGSGLSLSGSTFSASFSTGTPKMNGAPAAGKPAAGEGTDLARWDHIHPSDSTKANLASPAFTGRPTIAYDPAVLASESSTVIATTAWVKGLGFATAAGTLTEVTATVASPTSAPSAEITVTTPSGAATTRQVTLNVGTLAKTVAAGDDKRFNPTATEGALSYGTTSGWSPLAAPLVAVTSPYLGYNAATKQPEWKSLSSYAPLASPTFTGTPARSTDMAGTEIANELATAKFVLAKISGSSYTLPIATTSALGGVKVGTGLSINSTTGELSAAVYTLPTASTTVLGGVKVGTGLSVASDGTLSANAPPVTSVNSKTGAVSLTAADVGAATATDITNAVNAVNTYDIAGSAFGTLTADSTIFYFAVPRATKLTNTALSVFFRAGTYAASGSTLLKVYRRPSSGGSDVELGSVTITTGAPTYSPTATGPITLSAGDSILVKVIGAPAADLQDVYFTFGGTVG